MGKLLVETDFAQLAVKHHNMVLLTIFLSSLGLQVYLTSMSQEVIR